MIRAWNQCFCHLSLSRLATLEKKSRKIDKNPKSLNIQNHSRILLLIFLLWWDTGTNPWRCVCGEVLITVKMVGSVWMNKSAYRFRQQTGRIEAKSRRQQTLDPGGIDKLRNSALSHTLYKWPRRLLNNEQPLEKGAETALAPTRWCLTCCGEEIGGVVR